MLAKRTVQGILRTALAVDVDKIPIAVWKDLRIQIKKNIGEYIHLGHFLRQVSKGGQSILIQRHRNTDEFRDRT